MTTLKKIHLSTILFLLFSTLIIGQNSPTLNLPSNGSSNVPITNTFYWSEVSNASSYILQISSSSGFYWNQIDISGIADEHNQVTGLYMNSTYYWRVGAVVSGVTHWSTTSSFTTGSPGGEGSNPGPNHIAPSSGSTVPQTNQSLTWNTISGATYHVQVSTSPYFSYNQVEQSGLTTAEITPTGLYLNTTYYWRVNATVNGETTDWTASWSFTTSSTPPSIPSAPVLATPSNNSSGTGTSPTLTWNTSSGADSYGLQVSSDAQFSNIITNQTGITTTSYAISGLSNTTTYYWRVNATNNSGTSSWSSVFNFNTSTPSGTTPTLVIPNNGATDVPIVNTFYWNKVQGATYTLQISGTSNFSTNNVDVGGITDTNYQVTNLGYATFYYWRVGANDGSGIVWSNSWSFTTGSSGGIGGNPGPSLLIPDNASSNVPTNQTFVWEEVVGATYQIQISTSSYFGANQIDQSGLTVASYPTSVLYLSTPYYWRVNATTAEGTTDWSEVYSFTTSSTSPTNPIVPILASPENNATDVSTNANLVWHQVSGADSYMLQVATDVNFSNLIINENSITNTSYNTSNLSQGQVTYWRVKAVSTNGNSSWSAAWSFTTTSTSVTPILTVITPEDSTITNSSPVTVTGSVDDPANSVKINGTLVTVNGDGSFSGSVFLNEGNNSILITAYNDINDSVSVTKIVTYDSVAPVLTITSPADSSTTAQSSITLIGTVDGSNNLVTVNGDTVSVDGSGNFTHNVSLLEGTNSIVVVATDEAGNTSTETRTIFLDSVAPVLTITSPADSSTTAQSSITLIGTVDGFNNVVTVNGDTVTVDGSGNFTHNVSLLEGTNSIVVVATDEAGNQTTTVHTLIYNSVPPVLTVSEPQNYFWTFSDSIVVSGNVSDPNATLTINGDTVNTDTNGAFYTTVAINDEIGTIEIIATNFSGSDEITKTIIKEEIVTIPTDPAVVAPPLDSTSIPTFIEKVGFIFEGNNPIQVGVNPADISEKRLSLLRGKVILPNLSPLSGVRVTILDHPEYGHTYSRNDGMFDMVVNGGGKLIVKYSKNGYSLSQRTIDIPWQNFVNIDDVVLVKYDSLVTKINFIDSLEVARGSIVSDADGQRQATLMFEEGTIATMVMPDGSTQPLTSINVRATEYTVGESGLMAMPADLPPTSAYTYCVDLTIDEAISAGATSVKFNKPVTIFVDNFLDFPTGTPVPAGYYDRVKGNWIASESGMVIKIIDKQNGIANIDVTGDGYADTQDTLALVGISLAEQKKLALLYEPGKTLWATKINHFTPWDLNWSMKKMIDHQEDMMQAQNSNYGFGDCTTSGSIIGIQSQTLGERLSVVGTNFSLNFNTKRTKGYKKNTRLIIPVASSFSEDVVRTVIVTYAGNEIIEPILAPPNIDTYDTLMLNTQDIYGRELVGEIPVHITIKYTEDTTSYIPTPVFGIPIPTPVSGVPCWKCMYMHYDSNNPPPAPFPPPPRPAPQSWTFEYNVSILNPTVTSRAIGNWSISNNHFYDPVNKKIYYGNGTETTANNIQLLATRFAGVGSKGRSGLGGLATEAHVNPAGGLATDDSGNVYICETEYGSRVLKVSTDGTITRIAGSNEKTWSNDPRLKFGYNGDSILAINALLDHPTGIVVTRNGEVVIADDGNHRIRKIRKDGIIITIAGNGNHSRSSANNVDASSISLGDINCLAIGPNGNIYFGEHGTRIRRIDAEGKIWTIAGKYSNSIFGPWLEEGVSATATQIPSVRGIAVDSKGNIFFTSRDQIFKINKNGILKRVAGGSSAGSSGDGELAKDALLYYPKGLTFDRENRLYVTGGPSSLPSPSVIRMIDNDGIISTIAGMRYQNDGPFSSNMCALSTSFRNPKEITIGPDNSIYVSERHDARITKLAYTYPDHFTSSNYVIPSVDGAELYEFNKNGKHLETTNVLTGELIYRFEYDSTGYLSSITDADSLTTSIVRDTINNQISIIAPFGQTTVASVNQHNQLTSLANPLNETLNFAYTENGLLTSMINANNNTYTFTYDDDGYLIKDENPLGGFTELIRDESQGMVTKRTAEGRESSYVDNANYLKSHGYYLRSFTSESGLQFLTKYHLNGSVENIKPDGTITKTTSKPDPRFGLEAPLKDYEVTLPSGLKMNIEHTKTITQMTGNTVTGITDTFTVNGKNTIVTYDGNQNLFTTTSPEGRTSTTYTDTLGRVLQSTVPGIAPVTYTYNSNGFLSSVSQDGKTSTFNYNTNGRLQSTTDPMNRTESYEYDAVGRVVKQTLYNNKEILYSYDANGNLKTITPPGKPAHTFYYTAVDLTDNYTPPTTPDSAGGTRYIYNLDKQLVSTILPDSSSINITYDTTNCGCSSNGKPKEIAFSRGTMFMNYDTLGRLESTVTPEANVVNYQYDGSLITEVGSVGEVNGTVGFSYNNNFQVTSQSVNSSNTINYNYDNDGLLTQAGDLTITNNPQNGLLTGTTLGNISTNLTYNNSGEVISSAVQHNSTDIFSSNYTLDSLGRIKTLTENILGDSTTFNYHYNTIGYLVEVEKNDTVISHYSYDDNGNRTISIVDGDTTYANYDAQDRLLQYGNTHYAYSFNGNLKYKVVGVDTTKYNYDNLGNLTSVLLPNNKLIEYIVNANNRRIAKKVNGVITKKWLYSTGLLPDAELDSANNVKVLYGSGYLEKDGEKYRVISDHLGSVRLIVNSQTGAVVQKINYDAFGNVTYAQNETEFFDFTFASGIYDNDTKLIRFGARDYDAVTGRWISKDPIGFNGGVSNLYEYCVNDPVNFVDLDGLQSLTDVRDFTAGLISNLSFGATDHLFDAMGDLGRNNPCSDAYSAGEWTGTALGIAMGGKGIANLIARLKNPTLFKTYKLLELARKGKAEKVLKVLNKLARTTKGREQIREIHKIVSYFLPGANSAKSANILKSIQDVTRSF